MKLPAKAAIIEVLLRDGLQNEARPVPLPPHSRSPRLPRRPGSGPFIDRGPKIAQEMVRKGYRVEQEYRLKGYSFDLKAEKGNERIFLR